MPMSSYQVAIRVAQAMKNTHFSNFFPLKVYFWFCFSDVYVEFCLSRTIFYGPKKLTYRLSTLHWFMQTLVYIFIGLCKCCFISIYWFIHTILTFTVLDIPVTPNLFSLCSQNFCQTDLNCVWTKWMYKQPFTICLQT